MRNPPAVYAGTLAAATIFVVAAGSVVYVWPVDQPWIVVAAVLLIPVAAYLPYLLELILVSRLSEGWTGSPMPNSAAADVQATVGVPSQYVRIAVVTAVCEEVLFRGAVLPEVAERTSVIVGLLASSLLFAFHHISFGPAAVIGKMFGGFSWGLLYLAGGGVVVPIAAHLMFQMLVLRRLRRTEARA